MPGCRKRSSAASCAPVSVCGTTSSRSGSAPRRRRSATRWTAWPITAWSRCRRNRYNASRADRPRSGPQRRRPLRRHLDRLRTPRHAGDPDDDVAYLTDLADDMSRSVKSRDVTGLRDCAARHRHRLRPHRGQRCASGHHRTSRTADPALWRALAGRFRVGQDRGLHRRHARSDQRARCGPDPSSARHAFDDVLPATIDRAEVAGVDIIDED